MLKLILSISLIVFVYNCKSQAVNTLTTQAFFSNDLAMAESAKQIQITEKINSSSSKFSLDYKDSGGNDDGFIFLVSGGYRHGDMEKYHKHMVSIRSRMPKKYFGDNHFCGGTIIGTDAVLTAAHCVMDKRKVITRPRRLLIVAGTPNRLRIDASTEQYPVLSITAHQDYILKNIHDIAIIRIIGEFPNNNERIKIMELPKQPPKYGTICTTMGWGRMFAKGPLSALPTNIDILLFSQDECKKQLSNFHDGLLCAGDNVEERFNEDSCRGDTGGPFFCEDELTGIVSWKIGCGGLPLPSIYTDIYYHKPWILTALVNDCNHASFRMTIAVAMAALWKFL